MSKDTNGMVTAFLDPELKKDAQAILDRLGISMSAAVRMLFQQIVLQGGLPFEVTLG